MSTPLFSTSAERHIEFFKRHENRLSQLRIAAAKHTSTSLDSQLQICANNNKTSSNIIIITTLSHSSSFLFFTFNFFPFRFSFRRLSPLFFFFCPSPPILPPSLRSNPNPNSSTRHLCNTKITAQFNVSREILYSVVLSRHRSSFRLNVMLIPSMLSRRGAYRQFLWRYIGEGRKRVTLRG